MEPTHHVFNLIILDESGSMYQIKSLIISGFNEIVQTVQGLALQYPEQQHVITLVSFNSLATKTLLEREEVSKLKPIDDALYNPNGGTPLYDAMGNSIQQLRQITDSMSNNTGKRHIGWALYAIPRYLLLRTELIYRTNSKI
jgi:hypothetical protein